VGPRAGTLLVAKETRDCDIVGVRLHAGAAARVFGVPARELSGTLVDLDLLWGPIVAEIREQLHATLDLHARMHVVERAIQQRLARRARSGEPTMMHALCAEVGAVASASVAQVARTHGLTHRQVIDFFDHHVGLKPKQYQRVQRLRRVLRAIHAPARACWAQIAVRNGYFDQAHLIHDFRKLTGLTPAEYETEHMAVGHGFVPHARAAAG
jgi:AraC-like DNA-binding protein